MEMVITPKESCDDAEQEEQLPDTGLLPADHPMMKRFQEALEAHLLKMTRKLESEIVELDDSISKKNDEIAENGAKLFDLQNAIEINRDELDKYSRKILDVSSKRKVHEENAARYKSEFNRKDATCKDLKRANNLISQEIASMRDLESDIAKWNQEIQSEIALAKRVASKDSKDQRLVSEEKKMMDLILFNLDSEVRKNERELAYVEEQIKQHSESVALLNTSLTDANVDLEGLQQEHKKLMQVWGEVIVSVQHRDKFLQRAKSEIFNQQEEHKTIQSLIENTKKFVIKELDISEKLNEFKQRLLRDMTNIEKQVQVFEGENIKLEQKLDHFSMILEKTEGDLEQTRSEGLLTKNHLTKLINKLEKNSREKLEIEGKILDLLQEQITTDKAGHHRGKLLRDAQEERRQLEIDTAVIENKLSLTILALEKWRGIVQEAKEHVEQIKKDHDEADYEANSITEEIEQLKLTTKRKLITLDVLHKQLEQMIETLGGKEMNLKEIQVIDLEKKIAELEVKIKDSQQFWLRLQSMVVALSEKRAQQMDELFVSRKQLMVVEQKAIKVESELKRNQDESREIFRSLSNLNVKLDQTSSKLYEKRVIHEKDEIECELSHIETIEKVKEMEMSMLDLENESSELSAQIEQFKEEVKAKHYNALSWETKFKMAEEARKTRDEESAKTSEIGIMTSEIHRMEVKFAQIKKLQERMSNDLVNTVHHRDHIYDKAEVREKKTGTKKKTQSNIKLKMNEMTNKLKIISADLSLAQRQFKEYQMRENDIRAEIAFKDQEIQNEKMQDCLLQTEIEQSMLLKQQNLETIVKRQKRARRYKVLQSCTYLPKMKTEAVMDAELQRQDEIHENLLAILETLQRDFPAHKFAIEKIFQTLKN